MSSGLEQPSNSLNLVKSAAAADITFLDEIASPNTYSCQSVGQSVGDSFRFGDSFASLLVNLHCQKLKKTLRTNSEPEIFLSFCLLSVAHYSINHMYHTR